MAEKAWEIAYTFHHFAGLLLVTLVAVALYLTHNTKWNEVKVQVASKEEISAQTNSDSSCDYFSGRWVYDNISYPLYKESQCSFIEDTFACERNGRLEFKYQNWRWQPHQCDLPRFNGTAFLEKLRGNKLVFVGDSVNRNQYQSMLCLIESYLPPFSNKSVVPTGNMYTLLVKDYNATIAFYWSPVLVECNCDDPRNHTGIQRTIRLEAIEKHARVWTDADILIFDSYVWWSDPNFTLLWGTFGSHNAIYKRVMSSMRLYEIALQTWSDWLEINLNRTRTKLFFMGFSPIHRLSENWGAEAGNCLGETEMILVNDEKVQWGVLENELGLMKIAESAFQKLETGGGVKVKYLNITHLSAYRKEAHPSVYGLYPAPKHYRSRLQKKSVWNPDCLHWCLPGVPDVWNQILYAYIMTQQEDDHHS